MLTCLIDSTLLQTSCCDSLSYLANLANLEGHCPLTLPYFEPCAVRQRAFKWSQCDYFFTGYFLVTTTSSSITLSIDVPSLRVQLPLSNRLEARANICVSFAAFLSILRSKALHSSFKSLSFTSVVLTFPSHFNTRACAEGSVRPTDEIVIKN